MSSKTHITFRASRDFQNRLKARALELGITQTDLIARAVNQYLGSSDVSGLSQEGGAAHHTDTEVAGQLQMLRDQVETIIEKQTVMGEILVSHAEYYFTHHPPMASEADKDKALKSVAKQIQFIHNRVLNHVEDATGFATFEREVQKKLNPEHDEMVDVLDDTDIT